MKIVIDIPEMVYNGICNETEYNGIIECNSKAMADAIYYGTPLPKGHGKLIDADAFERRCMFDCDIEDMQDVIYAMRDYKGIIEADKTGREVEE